MLGSARVMAFVATKDAARAISFYRDVLGLRLVADEPYAVVFDAGGTMLRIQKVRKPVIVPYTALGWDVADIRAVVAELVARGVRPERISGMPQDADGVWTTPSGEQIAWFKDPDGHTLSLTQFAR